jgi:hypothetical protein
MVCATGICVRLEICTIATLVRPNAQVQGRALGEAEACTGGGVPCNAQLGRWWHVTAWA